MLIKELNTPANGRRASKVTKRNRYVMMRLGETMFQAIGRHRRETGFTGACIILNGEPEALPHAA